MANRTDPFAQTVHGTNPQYLVEKITRLKIYNTTYWKETCFGLTAATVLEKAASLKYCGGLYGGNLQPSKFLCLLLKLLQLQPEKEIILAYIENEDFKYVRALGAFYFRLVGKADEIYTTLEPLYNDFRKLAYRGASGWSVTHMDDFVDSLLREELVCDIALPHIVKRHKLEALGALEPRRSALEDELEALEQLEAQALEGGDNDHSDGENEEIDDDDASNIEDEPEKTDADRGQAAVSFDDDDEDEDEDLPVKPSIPTTSHHGITQGSYVTDKAKDSRSDRREEHSKDTGRERERDRDSRHERRGDSRGRHDTRRRDDDSDDSLDSRRDRRHSRRDSRERDRRSRRDREDSEDSRRRGRRRDASRSDSEDREDRKHRLRRHRSRSRSDSEGRDRRRHKKRRDSRDRRRDSRDRDEKPAKKDTHEDYDKRDRKHEKDFSDEGMLNASAAETKTTKSKNEKAFDRIFGKKSSDSAAGGKSTAGGGGEKTAGKVIVNSKGEKVVITAAEGTVEYWNQIRESLGMSKLK